MVRHGDRCTEMIMKLPNKHKLWRCINSAGTPYSYITDSDGWEVMNSTQDKEEDLLQAFYQYVTREPSDEDYISKTVKSNRLTAKRTKLYIKRKERKHDNT